MKANFLRQSLESESIKHKPQGMWQSEGGGVQQQNAPPPQMSHEM